MAVYHVITPQSNPGAYQYTKSAIFQIYGATIYEIAIYKMGKY